MVAQPPRRADDDMRALGQLAPLAPAVHAADAGHDARAGISVKPLQFALHLHREFARRRDDQRQRRAGRRHFLGVAEQRRGHGEAIGDGLAGAGLGGDEDVASPRRRSEHGGLHRRRFGIVALLERAGQRGAG